MLQSLSFIKSLLTIFFVSVISLGLFNSAHANNDLLKVEEAFQLSTPIIEDQHILIQWKIAKDYYLYRDKIILKSDDLNIEQAIYSKAERVDDPLFGKTDVYKNHAKIKIPYSTELASKTITFSVKYQGCAAILGVCYPPQTQEFTLNLPSINTNNKTAQEDGRLFGSLAVLNNLFSSNTSQPELLPVDDAFQFSHKINSQYQLEFNWHVADDYHLYQDKFKVKIIEGQAKIGALNLPPATTVDDPLFGLKEVYQGSFQATLPITEITSDRLSIEVTYQGCSVSMGVCYPPTKKVIIVNQDSIDTTAQITSPAANSSVIPATTTPQNSDLSETDHITNTLKNNTLWIIIGTFFVFGLLLSFTPCVFPMIPILSSIIVGQGHHLTTRRAFIMSLVYVLAMALTYTFAGVLAGMFGQNLQATFQNPWIIGTFSFIFILLALSMFGFYELQLPARLQSKLTRISNQQKGGTLTGVAVMGFLSALIVGPCMAPPLAGALIYIGQTGDAFLGGMALFAMSMGMGLPLIIIGTSSAKLMPRAGAWMEKVKAFFGVMLIGVAIWMLERILPVEITMINWAILLIITAVYMGAFESTHEKTGWFKLAKGLGIVLFLYGLIILIGLMGGSKDVYQPLKTFQGSANAGQAQNAKLNFKIIKSIDDLKVELAKGQPIMLDFYADWCISCKEMERLTFSDAQVQQALVGVTLLKADVTKNDDIDIALMQHFGIVGPPAILFFNPQGQEQKAQRVVGFKSADEFVVNIEQALP
ncbi:Cytochrome c-type biogenesis protein DsbD, protein-disulfide reductase [hydrothermal vent metagenome]|uniref:Thiol:disulfide interchange protein DsbD n=1 Tax=hydrothermal vent metagenome TaxID=652676 RepID=A0A3B0W0W7_9ZZZZ